MAPLVTSSAAAANTTDTTMNPGWYIQKGLCPMAMSRIVPPPLAVTIPANTAVGSDHPVASASRVPLTANTMVAI